MSKSPTPQRPPLALVITPTYNERDSIAEVVRRLFDACGERVDLLVIDDGSPDGTAHIVRHLQRHDSRIHLHQRAGKLGLGTAYVTGFRWAIERGYDAVVEMDADLSHDPADVPRLLDALEGADLVIGSRYVPGGGVTNWGRLRRMLSAAGNLYARLWLGYPVKDSTAGFRAYRTSALAAEDLDDVRSEGYGFQIEMTRRFHNRGRRIHEVPITFVERVRGRSKMSRRIVIEALMAVTRWGLRDRVGRKG
ncbi:MAG: polyprenol monophosphomannose synthase [Actinobacteria bacterium]|nr:polyprenol monophosphomannose synthase [Actinomycetota bacterium]